MKQPKRIAAGLLAGLLCLSLLPTGVLASGGSPVPETDITDGAAQLSISTVEELLDFRDRCTLDSWSRGRTVTLEKDLDLTGVDFAPIPSFRGIFDGQGHAITGLELTGKGSRQGLFRVIGDGGRVENLTVEGRVVPGGSRCSLGLLAGENAGTLCNCVVKGRVEGLTDIGGLTGRNTGVLEHCRAEVTVVGQQNTGGVCGTSLGVILGCTIRGEVNTAVPNAHITDPLLNTGGVVGKSEGLVDGCFNYAQVGYPHSGYNVGGVVGSHQGRLTGCSNAGQVYGRKGVGGIAGRFTPDLDIVYSDDPVEKLNNALSDLSASFDILADQVSDTVDRGVDRVEGLNDELEDLRDTTSESIDRQADFAREAVEEVHDRLQAINRDGDDIYDAMEQFTDASNREIDTLLDAVDDLRQAADAYAANLEDTVTGSSAVIQEKSEELERQASQLKREADALGKDLECLNQFLIHALEYLSGKSETESTAVYDLPESRKWPEDIKLPDDMGSLGDDKLDQELIESTRNAIKEALGAISDELIRIAKNDDLVREDSSGELVLLIHPGDHVSNIADGLGNMSDCMTSMVREVDELIQKAGPVAKEERKKLQAAAEDARAAMDDLNDSGKRFSDRATDRLKSINGHVDVIEDTMKAWGDLADAEGTDASDKINGHLDSIEEQVDGMTQGVRDSNDTLHQTTETIIRQLDQVRQAAYEMTEKPEYEMDDQSALDGLTSGYLSRSRNDAPIDGDANVGGIAGIVSFTVSEDPEEELDWDWEEDRPLLADVTAEVRAAVTGCRNGGSVNARNESVGGIVGRLDVGAVVTCVNTGDVSAEDGSSCGGIAGFCDRGSVIGSSARCVLTACDHVGGITGLGGDLTDCRAMVTVVADGEQLGAVSGWTEGKLSGNYALREGLGAMDSTDLEGQAQCLDYPAFSMLDDLPEDFLVFELTFVANGRKVGCIPFSYDGAIDESLIPAVPPKAEHYARWEEFPTVGLRRSRVVEAIYEPWDTTVSSGGSQPELLAEGAFSPEAVIQAEPWTAPEELKPWDRRLADGWSYQLTDPQREVQPTVRLRVLALSGGDHAAVALCTDQGLTLVKDARREGSYLIFEAPSEGRVVVLGGSVLPLLLLCGGGAALLLLGTGLLIRRRRRKRKPGGPPQTPPETGMEN